jgi:hypothetical protein
MAAVAVFGGCERGGGGPKRYTVTGTVTFRGQPVPCGRIDFEPDTERGNSGPFGTAEIRQGQYTTARNRGVVGGPHLVRILGSDGVPLKVADEGSIDPRGTRLFREYTENIDLPRSDSTRDFDALD